MPVSFLKNIEKLLPPAGTYLGKILIMVPRNTDREYPTQMMTIDSTM